MAARDESVLPGSLPGEAVVMDAWVVSDGSQDEFVATIRGLLEHLRTQEGFLDGAVLRGVNPTRFVSYARLRSPADAQRVFSDPEVSARMREASRVARADLHRYDVLCAFEPLPEPVCGG